MAVHKYLIHNQQVGFDPTLLKQDITNINMSNSQMMTQRFPMMGVMPNMMGMGMQNIQGMQNMQNMQGMQGMQGMQNIQQNFPMTNIQQNFPMQTSMTHNMFPQMNQDRPSG